MLFSISFISFINFVFYADLAVLFWVSQIHSNQPQRCLW